MAVKIQVKDGFDTTNYGFGVTPVTNTSDCGFNTNYDYTTGVCNTTMQSVYASPFNAGFVGPLSVARGPMANWGSTMSQGNQFTSPAIFSGFSLSEIVAKISVIDPALAGRIAGIGAQCIATANRIGRIASIDIELARNLARVASVDLLAVVGLSNLALVNPVAARMQLQRIIARIGFDQAQFANTQVDIAQPHEAAVFNVSDEGNAYRVVVRMPGMVAEAVEVIITNGKLVIKAKAQALATGVSAMTHGAQWTRVFNIGQDVSIDAIDAIVANGTLTVVLPKKASLNSVPCAATVARMSEVVNC
jgi:HSP20 family molecular chaperone IbpA